MAHAKFTIEQGRRIGRVVRHVERRIPDALPADARSRLSRRRPNALFAVKVTVDGGSAGSASSTCSWTYTVKTLSGRTLGTALSPQAFRWPNVPYVLTPADSPGFAYFDEAGDLQLYWANELPELEECEESTSYAYETGDGAFEPDGIVLSRSGEEVVSRDGNLIVARGYELTGNPEDEIIVSRTGQVVFDGGGDAVVRGQSSRRVVAPDYYDALLLASRDAGAGRSMIVARRALNAEPGPVSPGSPPGSIS